MAYIITLQYTVIISCLPVADDDENISLIEKLARLTVAQSGQAMEEYDPNTGAVARPDSAGDFRQPSPPEQDARKVAEAPNKSMNTKAMKTAHNKNMEGRKDMLFWPSKICCLP